MDNFLNVLVYSAGVYNILIGVFHLMFWRLKFFRWNEELPKMSRLNRGVMQIMNLGLVAVFFVGFLLYLIPSAALLLR